MPDCFKYAEYYHEPLFDYFELPENSVSTNTNKQSFARVSWISKLIKLFK